jgi:uncharacterized membrane protein YsdA (DUF1294 family)/cold shock CspA family protein
MRHRGTISSWKDAQGFGFITPDGGGPPVFVHIKSFSDRRRRPAGNEPVTYELAADERGRARAQSVAFAGDPPPAAARAGSAALAGAAVFLSLVAASVLAGRLPGTVLAVYLVASAVAFGVYAWDKSAAQNERWRTRERTLHLLALVGGWPGALAAQRLLRHKSRKRSFQVAFWMTVVANCSALVWLHTREGAGMLGALLGAAP